VVSRVLAPGAALVEVDPATAVILPRALHRHFEWAQLPMRPDLLTSTGVSDADEVGTASRYARTVALLPDRGHWDSLFEDVHAGRIPVRRLHPVG
jgi:hypothetical protein